MALPQPDIKNPDIWYDKSVGLLGGSFNPAHHGHRDISIHAFDALELDAIWWMVSPQNPNKDPKDTAPLEERIAKAHIVKDSDNIIVTDIETQMGTQYTVDSLNGLKKHFPNTKFIWLMGSDCLKEIHGWRGWKDIFKLVPVAVSKRPGSHENVSEFRAAKKFNDAMLPTEKAKKLKNLKAPAWVVLDNPLNSISSTELREKTGKCNPIA